LRGLLCRVGGAMCLTEFKCVLEQFLFVGLGQQAHRVVRVAGFAAGVDKRTAAEIRCVEPGLERAEHREQPFTRAFAAFHFVAQPLHPALVTTLQGGNHQFVFVGEVAVNAFSRDAGGFHQEVHARGGDAMAIDQLFGHVEDDVAGFITGHIVHVANSRTIVLLGQ